MSGNGAIHKTQWIALTYKQQLSYGMVWFNSLRPSDAYMRWYISHGILLIGPLRTNLSEILVMIHIFPLKIVAVVNFVCEIAVILSRLNALSQNLTYILLWPLPCSEQCFIIGPVRTSSDNFQSWGSFNLPHPHPTPRHNGRHFADGILTFIFMNGNEFCILIRISLFVSLRVQ